MSNHDLNAAALQWHKQKPCGKLAVHLPKPLKTKYDLSLAYSPGVAAPCLEIEKNPDASYDYTGRSNSVAVISNGTAVLGLGDLGALASKPVMEGKAALFKRFAGIDGYDVEVDEKDPEALIQIVSKIALTWGGINLEDIKAPECFTIEEKLKGMLDIPVFHDDQHGTAIVATAGLLNALELTGRDKSKVKIVINGAGSAAISCLRLFKKIGIQPQNAIMCDTKGVIYKGRTEGMNKWKEENAIDTTLRTLSEAIEGADVFIGLSVKGALSQDMVRKMAPNPIIFAMANPDPEITPEEARQASPNAIVATGRSDYPNQINNVMGFPYIFRGALDARASDINEEMKMAAAIAIAGLAKKEVINSDDNIKFGPNYIVPSPFDPRLMEDVSVAVAKAAIESGVARVIIKDWDAYRHELSSLRKQFD